MDGDADGDVGADTDNDGDGANSSESANVKPNPQFHSSVVLFGYNKPSHYVPKMPTHQHKRKHGESVKPKNAKRK